MKGWNGGAKRAAKKGMLCASPDFSSGPRHGRPDPKGHAQINKIDDPYILYFKKNYLSLSDCLPVRFARIRNRLNDLDKKQKVNLRFYVLKKKRIIYRY